MKPAFEKRLRPDRSRAPDRTVHPELRSSECLVLPLESAHSLPPLPRRRFQQGPFRPGPNRGGADRRPVLVIDDDPFGREALARILEMVGYRTLAVANGMEALTVVRDSPRPGLILLDLFMPLVNGWEFCARKREDPRLVGVPILVVSAAGSSQLPGHFPDVVGHFQKPVSVPELLAAICRHWQG
jgi:CheY-like chemotaxis protein